MATPSTSEKITLTSSDFRYKYWPTGNNAWTSYSSNLYGGRAGEGADPNGRNYHEGVVLKVKAPEGNDKFIDCLTITIPYVRENNTYNKTDTAGYLYFQLYEEDPKEHVKITSNSKHVGPGPGCSWNTTSLGLQTATVAFWHNFTPGKDYYIGIGAVGANHKTRMQIGYSGSAAGRTYSGQFSYYTMATPTAPSISIKDNGNNTATISGTQSTAGTNNNFESSTLYYSFLGYPGDNKNSKIETVDMTTSKYNYNISIPSNINSDSRLRAIIQNKFKVFTGIENVGSTNEEFIYENKTLNTISHSAYTSGIDVSYYAAPGSPGTPIISYTKSRLTIKEPWTFTWPAAKAANDDSPVLGYRIRLHKKDKTSGTKTTIHIKDAAGNVLSKQNPSTSSLDLYYDRAGDATSIKIYPGADFKVGDKVQLSVFAYTQFGDKTWRFSEAAAYSKEYEVQNAGVVHVKVAGQWKEGQVYVKVAGAWKEAETVNVKANGVWKESQ